MWVRDVSYIELCVNMLCTWSIHRPDRIQCNMDRILMIFDWNCTVLYVHVHAESGILCLIVYPHPHSYIAFTSHLPLRDRYCFRFMQINNELESYLHSTYKLPPASLQVYFISNVLHNLLTAWFISWLASMLISSPLVFHQIILYSQWHVCRPGRICRWRWWVWKSAVSMKTRVVWLCNSILRSRLSSRPRSVISGMCVSCGQHDLK